MFRVMWRNAVGHKLRLLLTALSIVLGVAFVTGSFVLTDTMKSAFNSMVDGSYKNVDVVVRGTQSAAMNQQNSFSSRSTIPIDLTGSIRNIPGVQSVSPSITGTAILIDKDGAAVRNAGAPNLGFSLESLHNDSFVLFNGRLPMADNEIAVEEKTLEKSGLSVGSTTSMVAGHSAHPVTIVGVMRYNNGVTAGATMVILAPSAARQYFAPDHTVLTIEVTALPGTNEDQLRDRIAAVLPASAEAVTGHKAQQEDKAALGQMFTILNAVLLGFALVALFVSSFIIYNTFAMIVAQRSREMALLRALGAKRTQVTRSILGESILVGLVGATVGLGLGILIAWSLKTLLQHWGMELGEGLPIRLLTIMVAYSVGVIVTVLSALVPAWRAGKAAPVQAMRGESAATARRLTLRTVVAVLMLGAGVALTLGALQTSGATKASLLGGGIAVMTLGTLGLTPVLLVPYIWLLAGLQRKVFGSMGKLATLNSRRNLRRSALTSMALIVGVMAVCAGGVFFSSYKASISQIVDDRLTADFVLTGGMAPVPPGVAEAARGVDSVAHVWALSGTSVSVNGKQKGAISVSDPADVQANLNVTVVNGSLDTLRQGQVAVTDTLASEQGWKVGQTVNATVGLQAKQPQPLTIGAIVQDDKAFLAPFIIPEKLYLDNTPFIFQTNYMILVKAKPGSDPATLKTDLSTAVKPYSIVSVDDREGFRKSMNKSVDTGLIAIYALLVLTIVIAILGIINTMALATFERTREIGLLRAIGTTRWQVRLAVTLESIVVTTFGALIGVILGIMVGVILRESVSKSGITTLAIPWLQIVFVLIASVIIGALAAVWPSFRAGRMNVLNAISTE